MFKNAHVTDSFFIFEDLKIEHCENKNVKFHSEVYNKIGNVAAKGTIYYDCDKNMLVLEKIDKDTEKKMGKFSQGMPGLF